MKMGKYNKFQYERKDKPQGNPIWRGIGCLIMAALPVITFGLTVLVAPIIAATNMIPLSLTRRVNFPAWVFHTRGLSEVASYLRGIDNLWLGVMVFFIILILLIGIASLIYVSVLQFIGPPRYSEKDAPPSRYKAKPYKR